jgi:hypothetical protein
MNSGIRLNCKPVTLVRCREIGGEKRFLLHEPPPDVGEHYFSFYINKLWGKSKVETVFRQVDATSTT